LPIKSVFQSMHQKNVKWNTLFELVWTWRRSGTVHSSQFSKIPHLGSGHSFHTFSLSFIALKPWNID
jgi:hypothetical protein